MSKIITVFNNGTRIMVSIILENLADGVSREEIMDQYSPLSSEDIDAALNYAAELARDTIIMFT